MGTKACKLCYAQTTSVDGGLICEMHHRQETEALRARVAKMEAAITNAIEMFSGGEGDNEGGPVDGIDWSGEIGMLRASLKD